mmetsp:Transcript_85463/g.169570  ORF Transcript_85463/g.169570 Transcript_85463/m.169570 type:complete len:109 (+) Transcript_85463:2-328(+)
MYIRGKADSSSNDPRDEQHGNQTPHGRTQAHMRASHKWRLAMTLVNNPQLAVERRHTTATARASQDGCSDVDWPDDAIGINDMEPGASVSVKDSPPPTFKMQTSQGAL